MHRITVGRWVRRSAACDDAVVNDAHRLDVVVVVNPERSDDADRFCAALGDRCDVDVRRPKGVGDIVDTAVGAARDGADVVAAVGGDGTQRSVAGALAGSDTALGVVPAGTVNLLGKALGIDDAASAAEAILGGARMPLDIGTVDDDTFILNSGSGYDADVIEHTTEDRKQRFGRVGYFVAGLERIRANRPRVVRVEVDGETWYSGSAFSVIVMNFPIRGSERFHLAPDARMDDGRIDVVVVRAAGYLTTARLMLHLARGRPPRVEDAVTAQGERIGVEWSVPVPFQRDGDVAGRARVARYGVRPGAVRICVPAGGPVAG